MDLDLNLEIGAVAGVVYRDLYTNGPCTAAQIKKSTGLTARQIDQAVGWLARESKLVISQEGRSTLIALAGLSDDEAVAEA